MTSEPSWIPSVAGRLDLASTGPTLTHEHFFTDLTVWACPPRNAEEEAFWDADISLEVLGRVRRRAWSNRANLSLDDFDLAVQELGLFRDAGGRTIVDVTPQTVGRDPVRLRALAAAVGVQMICGTGFYIHDAHPPQVAASTTDELAAHMVAELMVGIEGSDVRAGVIGEIGTSDPIHPEEVRVLEAAAVAACETGAAVTLHMAETARLGNEVLDLLERGGVDPNHVIMGHSSGPAPDMAYLTSLARRGAYVQFDFFGVTWRNDDLSEHLGSYFPPPCPDEMVVGVIVDLVRAGHGDRILLSHDTCLKSQLVRYGGDGYAHVLRTIVPQLRWCGLSQADVDTILIDNPRRALTWSKPAYARVDE